MDGTSRRRLRYLGHPRVTGSALGYLGLATLLLAVVWLFREGTQPAEPSGGLDGVRTALVTQVAYDLSASGSSDPVLVVSMRSSGAAPDAVGVAGFRPASNQTELHIVASGLIASSNSSQASPGYTVELQLRTGHDFRLGALRPAGKGRWSLQARLPYPLGEIRNVRILRQGTPILDADVAAAGRWAGAAVVAENGPQPTPDTER